MFHYFEAITNTSGDSLIGYFARVVDPATQNTVTISADDNGTPIVTVSGVENAAVTDAYGNLDFYVVPGTYHLDIYAPNATSLILRVQNVSMNSTKGDTGEQGEPGATGASNNSRETLAALKAADIADLTSLYDGSLWTWTPGNFTGQADDINVVKADSTMLSVGAWVRQSATGVTTKQTFTSAVGRSSQDKANDIICALDFAGVDPSGVTDSTAGLQAFLNAIAGRQGYLPAGTYMVSSMLDGPSSCHLSGDSRQTTLFKYNGATTIPGGAVLRFLNKAHFRVENIGFQWGSLTSGNASVGLLLRNCVYVTVDGFLHGGTTQQVGGNRTRGIVFDVTDANLVPPRGNVTFRNVLAVVELIDANGNVLPGGPSGAGSAGIHVKGLPNAGVVNVMFEAEGDIEHIETEIKLEYTAYCWIGSGWQLRGASDAGPTGLGVEIGLYNSANVIVAGAQIIPKPTTGIGVQIDANTFDTYLSSVGWNVSSGPPHLLIDDQGSRTTIWPFGDAAGSTQPGKIYGATQHRKGDGIGAHLEFIRSATDDQSVMIRRPTATPAGGRAWDRIETGGLDSMPVRDITSGGAILERLTYYGGHLTKPPTYTNFSSALAEVPVGMTMRFLSESGNQFIDVVKYSNGSGHYVVTPLAS